VTARDLGFSESCLRDWSAQADTDDGKCEGLCSDGCEEFAALR
jgi:transposase